MLRWKIKMHREQQPYSLMFFQGLEKAHTHTDFLQEPNTIS